MWVEVKGILKSLATKAEERASLFARMQKVVDRHSLMAGSIPVMLGDIIFSFGQGQRVCVRRSKVYFEITDH